MTVLDNFGHMGTLKLMDHTPTIHYTLAKLKDLAVVMTVWLTTMECSLLLRTGTMIDEILTVQPPLEMVVDGGIKAAIIQS